MDPINRVNFLQTIARQIGNSNKLVAKRHQLQEGEASFKQTVLTSQLRQLDPVQPDMPSKALAILVRQLLVDEFGESVVNEPAFINVITDVLDSLKLYSNYDQLLQFSQEQCLQAKKQ